MARGDLAGLARSLSARGWLVAGLGAVALRLDDGQLLTTPLELSARDLAPEAISLGVDEAGISGLFAQILNERAGARVVALTQPPETLALTMAGITVARCLLDGELRSAEAAAPPSGGGDDRQQLLAGIWAGLFGADDVLVDRFGLVSIASTADELTARLERLEHAAFVTARARQVTDAAPTSEERLAAVAAGLEAFGLRAGPDCARCNACSLGRLHSGAPDAFTARVDAAIGQHLARD
ncbi:MAG: class II aldolase/adducin family protein [Deltaproteobacteria bacterium]|nr:class II aldolase/adducin family protein [Deltaproteobacteria bacterium]